ncbi:hypothetical protein V490_03113 [Pseudogymnoascus sp. VKM F-3557]|nr:hypothetical protein V490_03113 [Pseudogymnoascus sp. VKM F-3557]
MKLPWKWCTPILLRLLALSQETIGASASAFSNLGSVHLVGGFYVGVASSPSNVLAGSYSQPRPHLSLDGTTFVQLSSHELSLPIMPLHLLGKKSWNVYNADNIEKVKRDEAIAQAKEEAEEQRMQDIDAARRIAILRGETPPPLEIKDAEAHDESEREPRQRGHARDRKKRKRAGEDDTDFEMRVAKEQKMSAGGETQVVLRKPTTEAPLLDESGHLDLFPSQRPKAPKEDDTKKAHAEKELAKRKKEYADNYTVKFSDAAGFKKGLENPWYSNGKAGLAVNEPLEVPSKDVWGNQDPRRKEREEKRIVSNDPLAAMKQGAAKVRQVARERKAWQEERDREMMEMERASKHKRRGDPDDELDGFSLDKPEERSKSRHRDDRRSSHGESRRRSHRDRSRDRERSRERRRHRHRHRSSERERGRSDRHRH